MSILDRLEAAAKECDCNVHSATGEYDQAAADMRDLLLEAAKHIRTLSAQPAPVPRRVRENVQVIP